MPNKPAQRWLPGQRPTTIPLYYAGESAVIGSILIARSFAKWLRKKHWAQYWRAGETLSWESPDDVDEYD